MSNVPSSAVRFCGVNYAPPGSKADVLHDFSLEIAPGEVVVLLGESGAGKSTALRLCNGLLLPGSGQVFVRERPTSQWDPIELRLQIGYVLQDDGLFPHFTVSQNVGLVPSLLGWPAEKVSAKVGAMLELVGLGEALAKRYPHQLSGGQRQRVGIARALAGEAPLLLLDEPFGRLDPLTRERLREDFARLCQELDKTALFVTHDLREALLLGDRVALLQNGRLGFCGTPAEFMATAEAGAVAYRSTLTLPSFNHVPEANS